MLTGWSSADITPDRPVLLHGQFQSRASSEVAGPLVPDRGPGTCAAPDAL
jgi:hypothetical protein